MPTFKGILRSCPEGISVTSCAEIESQKAEVPVYGVPVADFKTSVKIG